MSFGSKIDLFEYPVCNIFETKFLYDQLCYTTDLEKFLDMENLEEEFRIGLILLVDNNEDRQQCCKEYSKIFNLQFPQRTQSHVIFVVGVQYFLFSMASFQKSSLQHSQANYFKFSKHQTPKQSTSKFSSTPRGKSCNGTSQHIRYMSKTQCCKYVSLIIDHDQNKKEMEFLVLALLSQ